MQSRQHSTAWARIWSGWSVSRLAAGALCVCFALLVLAAPRGALAESRFALVIGNGAYSALPPLPNPTNDAIDVADALEALDFEVVLGLDLGRDEMQGMVDRIADAARTFDVVLFYYAGHGFQIDSENYLAPVDAKLGKHTDIIDQTVKLSQITEGLEGTGSTKLIFLDACRNNPAGDLLDGSLGEVRNGLARIGDAEGFLFAFSTQPDNVAQDGLGRNSPFTGAILSHIHTAGQDIGSMMISVRKDVLAATGGNQIPWENSSLTRQFHFKPGAQVVPPETMLWQLAARSEDRALARIYLDRYPQGAHADEAQNLLRDTQVAALGSEPDGAMRNLPSDDKQAIVEDQLWNLARSLRALPLVQIYLDQHRDGRHAAEALRLLDLLRRAEEADASPGPLCQRLATHPRDATANTAGVPFAELAEHADLAIETCRKAVELQPELPHFTALLARAMSAAGRTSEAVELYRDAAARGDLRAMVSLGLISETGDGAPKDLALAYSLYERAAEGGSPDGAINLAVALVRGVGIERDLARAEKLLRSAAQGGSAIATYNLGVLAQDGLVGDEAAAFGYFRRAAELGEPRAYVAAAILLDEGRGVGKDPAAAADMLLRGAASDYGEAITQLTAQAKDWSPETIKAVQGKLQADGFYQGTIDGISGPQLRAALANWRSGGFLETMQGG